MADPFISRDRRAYLLSDFVSETSEPKDPDPLRPKKDSKESKDRSKDSGKDKNDFKEHNSRSSQGEIIFAAAADAAGTDEAIARMTVGQKWAKPAELLKRDPVV
jgi:hypothetical protein